MLRRSCKGWAAITLQTFESQALFSPKRAIKKASAAFQSLPRWTPQPISLFVNGSIPSISTLRLPMKKSSSWWMIAHRWRFQPIIMCRIWAGTGESALQRSLRALRFSRLPSTMQRPFRPWWSAALISWPVLSAALSLCLLLPLSGRSSRSSLPGRSSLHRSESERTANASRCTKYAPCIWTPRSAKRTWWIRTGWRTEWCSSWTLIRVSSATRSFPTVRKKRVLVSLSVRLLWTSFPSSSLFSQELCQPSDVG